MRTQIKALTLCAVTLAAVTVADAYNQRGQERPKRKQAGFNCPVCDSPCINKAVAQRQLRQRRLQNQGGQQFQRNARSESPNPRQQGDRIRASQRPQQRAERKELGRFDIDGDGRLSNAEKTARRAYRNAMVRERDVEPDERPDPRPPVE